MASPASTPRRASARQVQKERETEAWINAVPGATVSLEWRVIDATEPTHEDDGWIKWTGGRISSVDGDKGIIEWPAHNEELPAPSLAWPLRPTFAPGLLFEIRNVVIRKKRPRLDLPACLPRHQVAQTQQEVATQPPARAQAASMPPLVEIPNHRDVHRQNQGSYDFNTFAPAAYPFTTGPHPTFPPGNCGPRPWFVPDMSMPPFIPGTTDPGAFFSMAREASDAVQRRTLAPLLTVPAVIPSSLRPFYCHIWTDLVSSQTPREQVAQLWEAELHRVLATGRVSELGKFMMEPLIQSFKSWIRSIAIPPPQDREQWMVGASILQGLLYQHWYSKYSEESMHQAKRAIDAFPTSLDYGRAGAKLKEKSNASARSASGFL
jgi:hypothetical protein